jgi:hypothetical protein
MTNPFKDEPIRAELADPYVSPRQPSTPMPPTTKSNAAAVGEFLWRLFIVVLVAFVIGVSLISIGIAIGQAGG